MATRKGPVILGMNYGGHDTAAALMIGGELVAACEQERYDGTKHSRAFPNDAIADCLRMGGVTLGEVEELAFVDDPILYIRGIFLEPAMRDQKRIGYLIDNIERVRLAYTMENRIRVETGYQGHIGFYRHHLCHVASAYYPSGFEDALLVSYDGIAELETGLVAVGRGGDIEIVDDGNHYPHSLGLLYSAVTHYLGWRHHCDEGIIMGLAPYGDADATVPGSDRSYYNIFREILRETDCDFGFEVNQSWMAYFETRDKWVSDKFVDLFGPNRQPGSEPTQHHMNVAAALQVRLEEVVLDQLKRAHDRFGLRRLALAGGVSLNCSMNGKIVASGLFDEIFVQPAAGDQGNSVGACYLATKGREKGLKPLRTHDFYKGSRFTDAEVEAAMKASGLAFEKPGDLYARVAERLEAGKIVGWFQGGAEFGPRALGNRSILCRPYPAGMKDHLNSRVKFREAFRPFAPAVLAENAGDYFEIAQESPHMLMAVRVRPDKLDAIPATVHVDGSCRVQTVGESNNPRFRKLLEAFRNRTGVPVVLNTSFNIRGEPIVNTPEQAIACFQSTNIDVLAVGDCLVEKTECTAEQYDSR